MTMHFRTPKTSHRRDRPYRLTGGDCEGFGGKAGGVSAAELEVVARGGVPLLADPCLGRGMGGVDGVDGCGAGAASIRCDAMSAWLRGRGTGGLLGSLRTTPEWLTGTLGPLAGEGVVGVNGTLSLTELGKGK